MTQDQEVIKEVGNFPNSEKKKEGRKKTQNQPVASINLEIILGKKGGGFRK